MCRLVIFFTLCGRRELEESSFSFYEDSTLVKNILRCTMLFHFYDIKSRFFFTGVFKTYPCIFFILSKISLYVFELLKEILENLFKYFYVFPIS